MTQRVYLELTERQLDPLKSLRVKGHRELGLIGVCSLAFEIEIKI